MNPNWTSFTRRIFIDAPVEDIYRLWATRKGMETWFLRKSVYTDPEGRERDPSEPCRKGDKFRWEWYNWDGCEEGSILDANGRDAITFTFADGKVDVNIESVKGKSLVNLVQSDIPTDDKSKWTIHLGCSNGWTFWMANMKAYLEHGVLLHNTEEGTLTGYDGFEMINL